MAAGVRVAPVGGVQIDENYKNPVLIEKPEISCLSTMDRPPSAR